MAADQQPAVDKWVEDANQIRNIPWRSHVDRAAGMQATPPQSGDSLLNVEDLVRLIAWRLAIQNELLWAQVKRP